MPLSGGWLYIALSLLAVWLVLLCRAFWFALKTSPSNGGLQFRNGLTITGMLLSAVAVGSLTVFHLSWISVPISQHIGNGTLRVLSSFLFYSSLAGLICCCFGSSRIRFWGIGSSLIAALWWFVLVIGSAISMGGPVVRHPVQYLIPQDYVGWVSIEYGVKGTPALQMKMGSFICQIPSSGALQTSSLLENGWARDEYFYYSANGFRRALRNTGWGRGGMVWAGYVRIQEEHFFVGTEEQYHRNVSQSKN
jgi:hypothetical protein